MPNITLPKGERREKIIQVRLNEKEHSALTYAAGKLTVSQWVRLQATRAASRKRKANA